MFNITGTPHTRIVGVAAGLALTFAVSGAALATTDTTDPDAETTHTEHADAPAGGLVEGSGEASSPEAAAFCEAAVAAEAASTSEDPELIEPAVEAVMAAAPDDEMRETVEAIIAALEADDFGPAFEEPYAALIDYMKANCGYAELNVAASEYAFGGLPPELPAGPTIVSLENIGEEVHEIIVLRINDDVDLALEEILDLDEEEAFELVTFVGIAFTFPGDTSYGLFDLTPGRHVALCFLPEGATPEVLMELEELGVEGPEDTIPEGFEVGPPHFVLGMVHEFEVVS